MGTFVNKKQNMPKVSVIIPVYNLGKYLNEAIDSVLASTFTDFEIIVVNNGDFTDTKKIISEYSDTRIKQIITLNEGVSAARNKAIKTSKGAYILPLDADDKITSDYIQKAVELLDNNPKLSIVYPTVEYFENLQGIMPLKPFSIEQILIENMIVVSSFFRRSDFDKTKGFNENMQNGLEDWDFWLSMLEIGQQVVQIKEVCFYYRIRNNSRNQSFTPKIEESLFKQIIKNHPELYNKYLPSQITLYKKIKQLESYQKGFDFIKKSKEYRLGLFLLSPIRFIKKLFV